MKDFEINVEQTFSYTFNVKAKDTEQAMMIATEKWLMHKALVKEEILNNRTMMVKDIENDEETNWIDF